MKHVIVDERIPKAAYLSLEKLGFSPIPLPRFSRLSEPVSAHPDMLLFFGDRLVFDEIYYNEAKNEIDLISRLSGLALCPSKNSIGETYPDDVAFNAFTVSRFLFCKPTCTAPEILGFAKRRGLEIAAVNQGYAKCSVCKVSESAIITSDPSIGIAAQKRGIDVLLITPGHVALPGYSYGFIGGASGSDGERVYFCGSLNCHPDGEAIKSFCKKHKKEAVSLSDEPLYDIGTIFFI